MTASHGIEIEDAGSATMHLHAALHRAAVEFPDVFADAGFPTDPGVFKSSYADVLPAFEAARADSPHRSDIARVIVERARSAVVVNPGRVELAEAVGASAASFDIETWSPGGPSTLVPSVPFSGRMLHGDDLVAEVDSMVERGSASPSVGHAIRWVVDAARPDGIDLRNRRIVMLGAGAELAPTRLWLDGGADVLWVDLDDPPVALCGNVKLGGTLRWIPGGVDLLQDAARVRATIEDFAGDEPIDIGLYAYAPGRAREWRLTAAMNAIVDALPSGLVRSVAMLVSPTTCGVLTDHDVAVEAQRSIDRPRWQRAAQAMRALGHAGGHAVCGSARANRGIVSIQGGSYQAAQYVAKLLTAEVWATQSEPIAVSANTAGVSLTSSLQHPVFDLAFAGAGAFDVETFDPPTTAALNGLLTLHDRLDAAMSQRPIDELFTTRVHGGIYVTPSPLDPTLRVAAAVGALRNPRRLGALLRR